jgi:hypothetical protein
MHPLGYTKCTGRGGATIPPARYSKPFHKFLKEDVVIAM